MAVEQKTMKPFLTRLAATTLIKEGLTAIGSLWQDNGLLWPLLEDSSHSLFLRHCCVLATPSRIGVSLGPAMQAQCGTPIPGGTTLAICSRTHTEPRHSLSIRITRLKLAVRTEVYHHESPPLLPSVHLIFPHLLPIKNHYVCRDALPSTINHQHELLILPNREWQFLRTTEWD